MKRFISKTLTVGLLTIFGLSSIYAQDAKKESISEERERLVKPYNPKENAEKKLTELVQKAQAEGKNIMIQAGGNWCIWCLRFNQYVLDHPELKKFVDENYYYYHLNYSKENKNEKLFKKFGNPGKYGFPVFVILDKNGKQIHTQSSDIFEDENDDNSYNYEKVKAFFEKWAPKK